MASECSQAGWRAITYPVEIGCRSYIETSIQRRPEVSGDHRIRAERGAQRSGGRGRTREPLALTPKKGQGVWKRGILGLAAGRQGDVPATVPPPRDILGLMERNISEGWLPADNSADSLMAPSEVRQEAMPSRYTHLCLHRSRPPKLSYLMWL